MTDENHKAGKNDQNEVSIHYKGLEKLNLTTSDNLRLKEAVKEYAEKFRTYINNRCDVEVNMKEFEKSGERHRYEAHCKFTFPGDTITSKGDEWDAISAIRDALESIKQQLESKFRDTPGKARASTAEFHEHYTK